MDFNGAVTIIADGAEYECPAHLNGGYERVPAGRGDTLQGLASWQGTIEVDGHDAIWAVMRG